jgi:hypothetical protein
MGLSKKTYLMLKNETNVNITNIVVTNVDNYDWDSGARPDNQFAGVSIRAGHDLK